MGEQYAVGICLQCGSYKVPPFLILLNTIQLIIYCSTPHPQKLFLKALNRTLKAIKEFGFGGSDIGNWNPVLKLTVRVD